MRTRLRLQTGILQALTAIHDTIVTGAQQVLTSAHLEEYLSVLGGDHKFVGALQCAEEDEPDIAQFLAPALYHEIREFSATCAVFIISLFSSRTASATSAAVT
eukprot:GHVS01076760.1.p1 GENE.GHVS01076760.1~~GHVS01076760.1.p1  ORF type:complete len:103 (+),score=12.60 GHVS01076760.1:3-311(+)